MLPQYRMPTMGQRISALVAKEGSQAAFGKLFGVSREMVGQWTSDKAKPKHTRQEAIVAYYGVTLDWLAGNDASVDLHKDVLSQDMVAGGSRNNLASKAGDTRTEEIGALTGPVYVIGEVQAGAWREAFELPEREWTEMRLPADPYYPDVPRYALKNVGDSMNRECANGGFWVFVKLEDLIGVGPQPGDYVIVRRVRHDGLIEATCKRLEIRSGRVWLCPDSTDPTFQPIPTDGDPETEEISVYGIVTDVVNRPGRRR